MNLNHALGAPLGSRLGSEAQAHMLQLALIERSLRRALWPFSQSLPMWGHKTQYVAWCGKPKLTTRESRRSSRAPGTTSRSKLGFIITMSASNPRTAWIRPVAERKSLITAFHSRGLSVADGAREGCVPAVGGDSSPSQPRR